MRFHSRVARASPRNSHPIISERMRIADCIRQASVGRFHRKSKRALFYGAQDSTADRHASAQSSTSLAASTSPGKSSMQLDARPRTIAPVETTVRQGGKEPLEPESAKHSGAPDDVGKKLFSQWSSRKNEPFSDVFQGRNDFFADLLKQRKEEDSRSGSHSQKWNGGSSRSDPFMTTISEVAEKDAIETSADKYQTRSMIDPPTTDTQKVQIVRRSLPQAMTTSVKTLLQSPEFDREKRFKALDTKSQATEAESQKTLKGNVGTAGGNQNGRLVEYGSTASVITETKTERVGEGKSPAHSVELRGTSIDLLAPSDDRRASSMLAAGAQTRQYKKALDSLGPSILSTEGVSPRSEALTDSSGYVPALTESSSEATGVTRGDHRMVPRSLDGPATVVSEMTEFSVFGVSKMSEPETSKIVLPAQKTDGDQEKNLLVERSHTPEGTVEVKSTRYESRTSKVSHPSGATLSLVPRTASILSEAKTSSEPANPTPRPSEAPRRGSEANP